VTEMVRLTTDAPIVRNVGHRVVNYHLSLGPFMDPPLLEHQKRHCQAVNPAVMSLGHDPVSQTSWTRSLPGDTAGHLTKEGHFLKNSS